MPTFIIPNINKTIELLPAEQMGKNAYRDLSIKVFCITAATVALLALALFLCQLASWPLWMSFGLKLRLGTLAFGITFASLFFGIDATTGFDLTNYGSKEKIKKYFNSIKLGNQESFNQYSLTQLVKYKYITEETKTVMKELHKDYVNEQIKHAQIKNKCCAHCPDAKQITAEAKAKREELNQTWAALRTQLLQNMG